MYSAGVNVKTQRKYDFIALSKCDNITVTGESVVLYQKEKNYRLIVFVANINPKQIVILVGYLLTQIEHKVCLEWFSFQTFEFRKHLFQIDRIFCLRKTKYQMLRYINHFTPNCMLSE